MRTVILLAVMVALAACGGNPTPAIPTAEDMTVQPTVTPGDDMADEGTVEATADAAEVVMNPSFMIQVSGDAETTIDSEDGAIVTDEMSGSPTQGVTGPLRNTPVTSLRILRFMAADESYVFELTFSQDTLAEGEYEIGVANVGDTVGNNANENAAGNLQNVPLEVDAASTAEATDSADAAGTAGPTATVPNLNTPAETIVADADDDAGSRLTSQNPPPVGPDRGLIETDETLAPIIGARLVPENGVGTDYNVVESGTLTLDSLTQSGVSGSFEFQLTSTENPDQTITVSGTFTDIPFTEFDDEAATPIP